MKITCSCEGHCGATMIIGECEGKGPLEPTFLVDISSHTLILSAVDMVRLYNYIEDTGLV